jgi:hypothetical protein
MKHSFEGSAFNPSPASPKSSVDLKEAGGGLLHNSAIIQEKPDTAGGVPIRV